MEREGVIKRLSLLPGLSTEGLSVIEVLVVVGLILIVVGAGIAPYLTQQKYLKRQFIRNRLQDEASVAMSYITKDLYRSKTVDIVSPTQLNLTIGTGPLRTDEETVVYRLSGINIQRRVGSGSYTNIASNIRRDGGLQFNITGNNCVSTTIVAEREGQSITITSGTAIRATRARDGS